MKHVTDIQIRQYAVEFGTRQTEVQRKLREETLALPEGNMVSSPPAGQLLAFLMKTIDARRVLEIGTYTGYSALAMALALPPGGQLLALDSSEEWTGIARRYWQEAGVADRIELKLGDAVASLSRLVADQGVGTFDFTYIDADKENYDVYYEHSLRLTRPGGLICFDNMFWGRSVADPQDNSPETVALRSLNQKIRDDERVDMSMLPFGDGMTLVRRRP
ncbi:class I SAM-dependent methyltransferase [Agrobacterium vitis]|uniref:Class I SAM-dependent methyltransferase n=1 Tax=Agrobacterium vitis TaxID=373 RepID=A0AAE2RAY5_AGRVI|nr:class I SAM-dependent methyltransferase [Agrobacterium vitis]MBF2714357.1 class I SAM-dependent methyltransferase [Agrobacterium vitis]MVA22019.1 methyltransferase [Agrobacterium vitis]